MNSAHVRRQEAPPPSHIVYAAMDIVCKKRSGPNGDPPEGCSIEAMDNVKPEPSRCVRAASVARHTRCLWKSAPSARQALAIRWLIDVRPQAWRSTRWTERLSGELMDAANNRGCSRQEARRHAPDGGGQQAPSAHYRW